MTETERAALISQLAALQTETERRTSGNFRQFFPDTGALRRGLYPKQPEFFAAGGRFKERLFMAANRVGKSEAGAYEVGPLNRRPVHHGGYSPVSGTNSQTTRDTVQAKLLGPVHAPGTGMIPAHLILQTTAARGGLAGAIEGAPVRHESGGESLLGLKTYEQGRQSFEGTEKHVIWCDDEPPLDCYAEMLMRTMTAKGVMLTTFTPLQGMSDVVKSFLEPETDAARQFKCVVQAGWKDVPHLTVTTFDVPESWLRVYGMDVGWNKTAVVWGARDPATGVVYLYSEHYQGQGEPASHAFAIKSRGDWIPGVIDPACLGSSQVDGRSLMDLYAKLGLRLEPAQNSVEAGIAEVWQLLVSGRLKVMTHLDNWLREFRKYHRDDKGSGKIVSAMTTSWMRRATSSSVAGPSCESSRNRHHATFSCWC
jgi:phage terminase large subunit-like protein